MEKVFHVVCPNCGNENEVLESFVGVSIYSKVKGAMNGQLVIDGEPEYINTLVGVRDGFYCNGCLEYITNNPKEIIRMLGENNGTVEKE